ncbi:MAG: methionyl-tRNA formyltransferase [Sphingobacteriales bacterium]
MMSDYRSLRIVFLGTPEFAKASLQALVEADCNIVGVITAPDKPAGRGMKLQQSAVKEYALSKGLHIMQPEKLKNPEFLNELKSLHADLQIVVAFRMLPEAVWNMPPLGTINLHASLLPNYRGAAPINWAVINGELESGVTTFKLQHEIDTGNILLQKKLAISKDESAGELHDRMMVIGAQLIVETVRQLANGSLQEKPQQQFTGETKHAPKIFTDTCKINWSEHAHDIHNQIRGLSPYPAAFTHIHNKLFKIYASSYEIKKHHDQAGSFSLKDGRLAFACTDGYIYPKIVQLEGKKKMPVEDFLRGNKI